MVQPCSLASTGQRLIPSKKGGALKIKGGQRMKMHIQNIRRRPAIIRHEREHAQRRRVEDEELQWQHWLPSISISWANGLEGEEEMLTSKHDSFHRKEVATVHICGYYYRLKECSSFAEVEYIAASLPMMLVAVQVPMQCLLAMHWLPKWPSTCRRKCLGPRIGHIWSIENIRTPLICRIKTNQNKIQP